MTKKQSASLVHGRRVARSVRPTQDSRLDFSDIPESTDEELKRAKRVGRPATGNAKQLIAIRMHPRLLLSLRKMAVRRSKPYQTFIHELLEKAVKNAA